MIHPASGSRCQKRHRIPDPQHCFISLWQLKYKKPLTHPGATQWRAPWERRRPAWTCPVRRTSGRAPAGGRTARRPAADPHTSPPPSGPSSQGALSTRVRYPCQCSGHFDRLQIPRISDPKLCPGDGIRERHFQSRFLGIILRLLRIKFLSGFLSSYFPSTKCYSWTDSSFLGWLMFL